MRQDHWREWWGDPDIELQYIRDMVEGRDSTRPYIFSVDGTDTGYIQYWFIGDSQCEPWKTQEPWVMSLEANTIGIDLSIGSERDLSKGIGSLVLSTFAEQLVQQGHTRIIIDPDPGNRRAIRAYEKAGFEPIPGLADSFPSVHLMEYRIDGSHGTCQAF
ncbi:GNAT family N-acetyltransferase [Salaquimonas pukyongi]|uniref:GNAT family N-acetyltransferase n=1 Tax=Salaquimonas pukyongi TaxID=2712698 RepID=UPI001FCD9C0B|nr:GNAT family N-acetyltransferase [Salaquimonas pukyongi]